MKTIDLPGIVEKLEIDVNDLAGHLFPNAKHARLALNRVMQNKSVLDANQISKLSSYTNIPINELYNSNWKLTTIKNILIVENQGFKAELDLKSWKTKVFDKQTLFHEEVLHAPGIGLSDYLNLITEIINKYRDNEQISRD